MSFTELGRVIETLGKERGIDKKVVVEAIEQAFLVTARKKFGLQGEYETRYNAEDDDVEIYQYKSVVNVVKDPILEIILNDAKVLDADVEVGDQVGIRIENPNFSRVDVQTARQIIFQKVRDAEREILFAEFKHREKEMITGTATRYERGNIVVNLGKAEAILPRREIIPSENFKPGDRIQAYLSEVVMTNRGPEIRLSRTSPMFLVKLFENEVPEIQDGTIEIKSAAREPGQRAKIAVRSTDREIDPVGACVGMKGSRVQNIVNELQGEKIDIVKWSDELTEFARAALAPAEIANIMIDSANGSLDVVVEDDQLSLAIGRKGQNVRLAAMLSGYKINIISKTKLQSKIKRSTENLLQITTINDPRAQVLVQSGIMSVADLNDMTSEELREILNVEINIAEAILAETKAAVENDTVKLVPTEEEEIVSASAVPAYKGILDGDSKESTPAEQKSKFSDAEKRLREELAAFKLK
ncbi:MAG: transcription termination factor NusA [Bdellovibrionales bacterium RIFOXYD12_FULL_39_22]|nr:MAG: transcription termination factor NusA [Bdellovibrionales bacterium RIFOXYB1_FULL_39_21]OFZ40855.1 MAG: transcription termination factor NusA [Bdellovibrionales bacterium RIFOXYC12_FULL_39_17]OFZ44396.1 MAG: transcription termination factor NusA [Bdellovibrionales bacterium RIFOXYC1_FULL_39_130]OFZ74143.1 MAG: transcription termination factor NusA [Bdellovibrionales bacterium RIFOXYD1_FULL_39_84]OFZ91992.1 MAG: transcription termination factor NusA [Bdellovibrionales bacterium RIFOXYD12_